MSRSYQWLRNDVAIAGATAATLDLAVAGHGNRGDRITVRVTASDGQATTGPVQANAVVVANSPPAATVTVSPATVQTDTTMTATATKSDPDGDAVSLTWTWSVNGVARRTFTHATALSDTFDLGVAGNGNGGDTVQVAVTPSDGSTMGTPATASVTVTGGPTQPVTYALDTFSRTVVDGFGSTSPGGTYSLMGTGADFDVAAGTGTISLAGPNANRAASLTSVSAQDLDLSFRFATNKLATGSGQYIYGVARRVSATASYRIKVRLTSGGAVWVGASSVTNNVESPIAAEVRAPNVTHVAGGFIRVRAQLTGTNPTTIRVRAWADGSTEPSTWTYTATNSAAGLQAPGGVGLQAYLSSSTTNAPVLVSVDDLRATGVGGP